MVKGIVFGILKSFSKVAYGEIDLIILLVCRELGVERTEPLDEEVKKYIREYYVIENESVWN